MSCPYLLCVHYLPLYCRQQYTTQLQLYFKVSTYLVTLIMPFSTNTKPVSFPPSFAWLHICLLQSIFPPFQRTLLNLYKGRSFEFEYIDLAHKNPRKESVIFTYYYRDNFQRFFTHHFCDLNKHALWRQCLSMLITSSPQGFLRFLADCHRA